VSDTAYLVIRRWKIIQKAELLESNNSALYILLNQEKHGEIGPGETLKLEYPSGNITVQMVSQDGTEQGKTLQVHLSPQQTVNLTGGYDEVFCTPDRLLECLIHLLMFIVAFVFHVPPDTGGGKMRIKRSIELKYDPNY
jgi:hypothetical protein